MHKAVLHGNCSSFDHNSQENSEQTTDNQLYQLSSEHTTSAHDPSNSTAFHARAPMTSAPCSEGKTEQQRSLSTLHTLPRCLHVQHKSLTSISRTRSNEECTLNKVCVQVMTEQPRAPETLHTMPHRQSPQHEQLTSISCACARSNEECALLIEQD